MAKMKRFEVWAFLPAEEENEQWQLAGDFSSFADANKFARHELRGTDGVKTARVVDSKEEHPAREYSCEVKAA